MSRKNEGMTTIVAVCVMAIVMALSLSLFLTASVLLRNSAGTGASEQCRILAVTLSNTIKEQLTDEERQFESRIEEETDAAADAGDASSLWHYIRDEITSGSWPYYEEGSDVTHLKENAYRTFAMNASGTASEIADSELTLYWLKGQDDRTPKELVVQTRVTVKGKSCLITDRYLLMAGGSDAYESWRWVHEEKS